jgi:hypothetical protein
VTVDDDERKLFGRALRYALSRTGRGPVLDGLFGLGVDDARLEDEPFVLGTIFETSGELMLSEPLLDLLGPRVDGHPARLVLPALDTDAAPGALTGNSLRVDGMCLTGGRGTRYWAVPCRRDDGSQTLALLEDDDISLRTPSTGFDPAAGVERLLGELPRDLVLEEREYVPSVLLALLRRCLGHTLAGLGQRMLDATLAHVQDRKQFGAPIAHMQTVQHRLADVHVALVAARSVLGAAWSSPDPLVSLAGFCEAAEAASLAARHAQQLTGAQGFTEEHGLHHVVRRTYLLSGMLSPAGDPVAALGAKVTQDPVLRRLTVDF